MLYFLSVSRDRWLASRNLLCCLWLPPLTEISSPSITIPPSLLNPHPLESRYHPSFVILLAYFYFCYSYIPYFICWCLNVLFFTSLHSCWMLSNTMKLLFQGDNKVFHGWVEFWPAVHSPFLPEILHLADTNKDLVSCPLPWEPLTFICRCLICDNSLEFPTTTLLHTGDNKWQWLGYLEF